jgi:hypothetical protein
VRKGDAAPLACPLLLSAIHDHEHGSFHKSSF